MDLSRVFCTVEHSDRIGGGGEGDKLCHGWPDHPLLGRRLERRECGYLRQGVSNFGEEGFWHTPREAQSGAGLVGGGLGDQWTRKILPRLIIDDGS